MLLFEENGKINLYDIEYTDTEAVRKLLLEELNKLQIIMMSTTGHPFVFDSSSKIADELFKEGSYDTTIISKCPVTLSLASNAINIRDKELTPIEKQYLAYIKASTFGSELINVANSTPTMIALYNTVHRLTHSAPLVKEMIEKSSPDLLALRSLIPYLELSLIRQVDKDEITDELDELRNNKNNNFDHIKNLNLDLSSGTPSQRTYLQRIYAQSVEQKRISRLENVLRVSTTNTTVEKALELNFKRK